MATALPTFHNWIKSALAVLITKNEVEPVVYDEIEKFQKKCIQDITTSNRLSTGSTCNDCCTENLVKCPTDRICNVNRRNKCSYHRNAATCYRGPKACQNNICNDLKSEIQNAHRYDGPSFKNTDAKQWCSNSWEIAKCYMPPEGYKDVSSAIDTDFNGIISVIINHKEFDTKISDDLTNKDNIFEKGKEVGRAVRHSPKLEVEDTDLTKYFTMLNNILSDKGFLKLSKSSYDARQKLTQLQKDELIIGEDVVRKVLKDIENNLQNQIKNKIKEVTEIQIQEVLDTIKKKLNEIEIQGNVAIIQLSKTLKSVENDLNNLVKESLETIRKEAETQVQEGKEEIRQETKTLVQEGREEIRQETKTQVQEGKEEIKQETKTQVQEGKEEMHKEKARVLKQIADTNESGRKSTCSITDEMNQTQISDETAQRLNDWMIPDPIVQADNEKRLFNFKCKRDITELRTTTEKNDLILKTVRSKGKNGFEYFKNILNSTHQEKIVKFLTNVENDQDTKAIEQELDNIAEERLEQETKKVADKVEMKDLLSCIVCSAILKLITNDNEQNVKKSVEKVILDVLQNKESAISPQIYKDLKPVVTTLFTKIEQASGAPKVGSNSGSVIIKFSCKTSLEVFKLMQYLNSEDLQRQLKQLAEFVKDRFKINEHVYFKLGLTRDCLERIMEELAGSNKPDIIAETSYKKQTQAGVIKPAVVEETSYMKHKQVLDKTAERLNDWMIPYPIVQADNEMRLFDFKCKRNIEELTTTTEKNELILNTVRSKGKNGLEDFKSILNSTHQEKLVEFLTNVENGQDTKEIEQELDYVAEERLKQKRKKIELKEKLLKFYKENRSTIPLSPLLEAEETNLAGFYVMPDMFYIKQKSRTSHEEERTPVRSLSDLLNTGSNVQQKIYISADAGFGKTSFSKYLAITWSQACCQDENRKHFKDEELKALAKFDFLFLILLRDCTNVCTIDKMIEQEIRKNISKSDYPLDDILSREKCLIILDGLDEWIHPVNECRKQDEKIPHRYARENCVILTTTRPWKLGVINLKTSDINKKVELVKLSKDSTNQLEKNVISEMSGVKDDVVLKEKTWEFHQDIVSRGLENMQTIPLLLMYITCLWCCKIPIGNSKIEVYINIIEYLLSRTVKKHPDVHPSSETSQSDIPEFFKKSTCQEHNCKIPICEKHKHKYCQEFYSVLRALAELAYHTLYNENRENTLVFDQCVAEKYLKADDMKLSLLSGILTGSTTRTLMEQSSKVSFSHKTVQEFFAALFISSQSDGQKQVLEKCTNVQSILDMSMICEFLSKMNSKMMCEILPGLMSVINVDEETSKYRTRTGLVINRNGPLYHIQKMLMSCLKQMPESENMKLCLQDFFIDKDTIHDENLQRLSKQNQTNMKSLYIYMDDTNSSFRDVIAFFSLTELINLQTLYYDGDNKETELSLLLSENLQHVELWHAEWTNYGGNVCERLTALKHVQYLDISDVILPHEIRELLYDFISNNKTIKQLTLWNLYCKEHDYHDDCTGKFDLSIKHSQLEKLILWQLPSLNLTVTSQSLVGVELRSINLGESSLLLSRDMINIKHVLLSSIQISAERFRDFINVVEELPQSVTVMMYTCDIKPETEYERVRKYIRSSQKFDVTQDEKDHRGRQVFKFQTTTRSSTTTTRRSARAIQETTGSARNLQENNVKKRKENRCVIN